MALCLRLASRSVAATCSNRVLQKSLLTTSSRSWAIQQYSADEWEKKNEKMGRPLSPHLSIYKFQLTSMLSITHRMTGVGLHMGLIGFAGAMVLLPNSYPYYLTLLAGSVGGKAVLAASKFVISWPFFFHAFNGVRHLVWDMGKGFSVKTLYKSGYTVVALSVLAALAASVM